MSKNAETKNLAIYSPTIYLGKDENDNPIQINLASINYVDKQLKAIKDLLCEHILNYDTAHDASSALNDQASLKTLNNSKDIVNVVNMPEPRIKSVSAKAIKQDGDHRMISDAQLELFRKRPSKQEIQDMISTSEEQIRTEINNRFTDLLNMPNAIERLKKISILCNSDADSFSKLIEALDDTISVDEFISHVNSNKHVNNVDRKALNLLLDCIDKGFIDQMSNSHVNTADTAENALKLNGKTFSEICNSKLESMIFAPCGYSSGDADHIFAETPSEDDYTAWQNMINNPNTYGFKSGVYTFLDDGYYIFTTHDGKQSIANGAGNTVFEFNNTFVSRFIFNNIIFKSNTTREATLNVESDTEFNNCTFNRCNIVLNLANRVRFSHCRFENGCRFTNNKSHNVFITENFFDSASIIPSFLGPDWLIGNNLY